MFLSKNETVGVHGQFIVNDSFVEHFVLQQDIGKLQVAFSGFEGVHAEHLLRGVHQGTSDVDGDGVVADRNQGNEHHVQDVNEDGVEGAVGGDGLVDQVLQHQVIVAEVIVRGHAAENGLVDLGDLPIIDHSIIQLFIQSFDYSIIHSIIQSFNHSIIQSFNQFNHSIIQSFSHSIIQSFNHSIIQSFLKIIHFKTIQLLILTIQIIHSGIYNVVLKYGSILDLHSIVPSQLPLLIEFLESYRLDNQFKQLSSTIEAFDPNTPDLEDSLSFTIDSVYVLTRCICKEKFPPQIYLKQILKMCNREWKEEEYLLVVNTFKRFTRKLDLKLLSCFDQKCFDKNISVLEANVNEFSLNEEDKARFYALSSFSNTEVRLRLALIIFYNKQLNQVMHLIELVSSKTEDSNTLGKYISLITGYIFLPVKESLLELSINQTVYHGKDCYPVIELDNRRVFTDMEKTTKFEEEVNALTSQCTFAQLYRQLKKHNIDFLRAHLDSKDRLMAIKYKGEQGLDWGGLYHDTIERW